MEKEESVRIRSRKRREWEQILALASRSLMNGLGKRAVQVWQGNCLKSKIHVGFIMFLVAWDGIVLISAESQQHLQQPFLGTFLLLRTRVFFYCFCPCFLAVWRLNL
jgi:hypothetical protein